MATSREFHDYVLDCLRRAGDVTTRRMMGEYCVYYQGRLVGDICDNRLLLKQTPASQRLLADCALEYPYEGAKNRMFVMEEFEDAARMCRLLEAMYPELPAPKPRRKKQAPPKSAPAADSRPQPVLLALREHGELLEAAAGWFHAAWGIPQQAYLESMQACLAGRAPVPQWYVMSANGQIVAGLGVIENDFHDRKDLVPNVCAVYTLPAWRGRGLAGALLGHAARDLAQMGVDTLYLLTDHTSFYERYGWQFYCMVQGDGAEAPSCMYIHRQKKEP